MSPRTRLQIQMQAECVAPVAGRWNFSREGLFGVAQEDGGSIEAVFAESEIHYRMTAPFSGETVYGVLEEANGSWSGTTQVLTSCGWKAMTVHAQIE